MNKHYPTSECVKAIETATQVINKRTSHCTEYTRGHNDCAALLVEYDRALRGNKSKAGFGFRWKTTREFVVKLAHTGFTVETYLEFIGYEIITNKRPLVGDVAFDKGGMIASPSGWISTKETNEGVSVLKQVMFLDRKISIIARPIKD